MSLYSFVYLCKILCMFHIYMYALCMYMCMYDSIMCECIYICMCDRMSVWIYLRSYICMYLYMYICLSMYVYLCVYIWMCLYTYVIFSCERMPVCTYVCMCEFSCVYVCVSMYVCMYVCTYIWMNIFSPKYFFAFSSVKSLNLATYSYIYQRVGSDLVLMSMLVRIAFFGSGVRCCCFLYSNFIEPRYVCEAGIYGTTLNKYF